MYQFLRIISLYKDSIDSELYMIEKLEEIVKRYEYLTEQMGSPEIFSDIKKYREITKEHSDLEPIVKTYHKFQKVSKELKEAEELVHHSPDVELKVMAKEEIHTLLYSKKQLEDELKNLLIPKDPNEDKNAIMEIRAGTGGEEAALFAADLFRMYSRYIEKVGWQIEEITVSPRDTGGFKEIIYLVKGKNAFGRLRYEGGVHRVQRVPVTEASGRIHTSAATVAVLPEAEEIDIEINSDDLEINVYRSTGPGGQSVNTTDSAVRITHIPTGLVVTCQDEKSQHKNKAKALKVLRSRLFDIKIREEMEKTAGERRSQISTGDRSAKIRTYNFPEKRVTDHRITYTVYRLDEILEGEIDDFIEQLKIADRAAKLATKTR